MTTSATDMTPLFSIITVCYNASDNLKRTIASIDSQNYENYEHIVIDGNSTDDTVSMIAEYQKPNRIFLSEPDDGIYDAMNKGLGKASGDYLIFMNAGDRFHSDSTLQTYVDEIERNNYPGIVYGQTDLVDAAGNRVGPRHLRAPSQLTLGSFSDGMLVCHQALAVLKRIAPLYDLKYRFSADYDWVIKCLQHSRKNVYVDQVVCDYLSEGVTTANRRRSLIERFKIMCRYYGTFPTAMRHIRFAIRFIRTKK